LYSLIYHIGINISSKQEKKPLGFHPFANISPVLAENQRQAGRIPSCGVPLRGAKTPLTLIGFSSLCGSYPVLAGRSAWGGQNTVTDDAG
jgi:hypothetical protein